MKKSFASKLCLLLGLAVLLLALATACGSSAAGSSGSQTGTSQGDTIKKEVNNLQAEVKIDGSNALFAPADAVAKEFNKSYPNVTVDVGVGGTTSGIRKLIRGKIDICNASSPMDDVQKDDSKEQGIEFVELKTGFDGVAVVVNKNNNWLDSITVDELKKIWAADSTAAKWKDINPKWPDADIKLYAPDGVKDFFSEAVNEDSTNIRQDVIAEGEDGKALTDALAADPNGMAIMEYGYFKQNNSSLKALAVDAGSGAVKPEDAAVKNLTYKPLSRPLYVYVNKKSLENEGVKKYLQFFFGEGSKLIGTTGIVPLDDYSAEAAKLK